MLHVRKVFTDLTRHLATSRTGTSAGEVHLCIRPALLPKYTTQTTVIICSTSVYIHARNSAPLSQPREFNKSVCSRVRFVRTDSLSDTEDSRGFPARCRLLLVSEEWLVTVERRVDIKLLLVNLSLWGTQSRTPRHGMYFAIADLRIEKWKLERRKEKNKNIDGKILCEWWSKYDLERKKSHGKHIIYITSTKGLLNGKGSLLILMTCLSTKWSWVIFTTQRAHNKFENCINKYIYRRGFHSKQRTVLSRQTFY